METPVSLDQLCNLVAHPVGGGRPRKLRTNGKVLLARQMFADKSQTISEICTLLGISRATFYRYLKETQPPD